MSNNLDKPINTETFYAAVKNNQYSKALDALRKGVELDKSSQQNLQILGKLLFEAIQKKDLKAAYEDAKLLIKKGADPHLPVEILTSSGTKERESPFNRIDHLFNQEVGNAAVDLQYLDLHNLLKKKAKKETLKTSEIPAKKAGKETDTLPDTIPDLESVDAVAFQRELRQEGLKLREEALRKKGLQSKVIDASKLPPKPKMNRPGKVVAANTLPYEQRKLLKKSEGGRWVAASAIQKKEKEDDSPKLPEKDSKKPKLK